MSACQSGFHDQTLQKALVKVPVESGSSVVLCDFCLSRIMEAQQEGGDLTMTILYQWAKECGDILQFPFLNLGCMDRCSIVQFVNRQLLNIRDINVHFPKILLTPDEKERFIRTLKEDQVKNEDSIRDILLDKLRDRERKTIALRLWTGCLCAAKECWRTSVSEHNPDGTTKKESHYTPDMRAESFEKIMRTVYEDPIYRAGVEVAPVWELIENAAPGKKMHLDGIPNLSNSPVMRYLKDKSKTIISADDIEINE
jgi:hypothetical protein